MTPERLAEIGAKYWELSGKVKCVCADCKTAAVVNELLAEVSRLTERESFLINTEHARKLELEDAEERCSRLTAENAGLRKALKRIVAENTNPDSWPAMVADLALKGATESERRRWYRDEEGGQAIDAAMQPMAPGASGTTAKPEEG